MREIDRQEDRAKIQLSSK